VQGTSVIDDAGADDPEAQGQVRQHAAAIWTIMPGRESLTLAPHQR